MFPEDIKPLGDKISGILNFDEPENVCKFKSFMRYYTSEQDLS